MKKSRLLLFILLIFVVTTLTGCVDAKFHLTVNDDGSGDFSYKMLLDPSILALASQGSNSASKDPLGQMLEEAKKSGFTTTSLNENGKVGYEAKKHIDDIQGNLKKGSLFGDPNMDKTLKPDEGLTIEKGLLKDHYKMKLNFDMSSMTKTDQNENPTAKAMAQSMLRSMNFNFLLSLPVKSSINNASTTEDNGKTLVWNLIPGQDNVITMEADIWNTTNILLLGGGALIILVIIIALTAYRIKNNHFKINYPSSC
jgi:Protein of unknown function (DUF3153).